MAATYAPDLVLDNELVRLGIVEVLEQNVEAFNASSNGTMTLTSRAIENDFADESFIKALTAAQLVSHRDYTGTGAVTPEKLVEGKNNSVKLSRRYGPFETTYDAWNRSNRSVETFSLAIGTQLGKAILADMVNTSIVGGTAAISAMPGMVVDNSANVFDYKNIVDGLATMGDKAGQVRMLVMHSNTYFSVVDKGLSMNALENVGGATIREGGAYSLGLPVLVTDSPALDAGSGVFNVLGLTDSAINCVESDETIMKAQDVLLGENLKRVIQGEGSYNLGIKGCSFDTSKANPANTDLGTAGNWTYNYSDVKSGAGFLLKLKGRA